MTNEYDRFNSWKVLIHSDKLKTLANTLKDPNNPIGDLPYPINWHIYPSNICPYKCNFCIMTEEKKNKGMLDKNILQKAINDAARLKIDLIHFSGGGEPLTNPFLSEIIEYAKMRGVKTALSTNGYLLNKLNSQVDHLRISFNAGTRELYKAIHGVDAFDKVIENIKTAVKQRKGKDIGMGFVITPENYKDIDNFIKVAEECNVDFVHIRPAFLPDKDKIIRDIVKEIKPHSEKIKVFSVSDKFKGYWDENRYPCRATPLHAVLSATGEFMICQDIFQKFGNYYTQSFEEIWFSKEHYDTIKKVQGCKIRCVECRQNEIIEEFFIKNSVRCELI